MKAFTRRLVTVAVLMGTLGYVVHTRGERTTMFRVELPAGYRNWCVISVAHEGGSNNDLRAVLGNAIAVRAYREGIRPFPDGAMIARLAWRYVPSEENDAVFGRAQSFVAGSAINVQISVKDSKSWDATGGWGFAQFKNGRPDRTALIGACAPCHAQARSNDSVFTRYSASP